MKSALTVLWVLTWGACWGQALEPASSAELCGRCHRAILEAWKTSAHSRAMESALFQHGLQVTEKTFGQATGWTCLGCHAPLAGLIKDLSLQRKVSWEGVTCDYCHSIQAVSLSGANPKASLELSLVKSGPFKDVVAPAHATRFSAVHTSALICAPCHEYRNSLGFPVLTTYSEWEKTRYAKEGRDCQSCHMYSVAGQVVDPRVLKTADAKINLHQMPGSHSVEQLTRTVKAQLSTSWAGDKLNVVVEVSNAAAGHYVPTGSPMRQLILEVTADPYGGQRLRQEKIYRRIVADKQGKQLELEPYAFVGGARTLSDSRLAPDEKRTENFTFPIPAGTQTQVQATFWYYYSPLAETDPQRRLTFLTLRRLVR